MIYDVPAHIESVDCFALEPVGADYILTGDKMMDYLNKKFPKIIERAKKAEAKAQAKTQPQPQQQQANESFKKKLDRLKYLSGIRD